MSLDVLLDVREMPPRERHPKIFEAWEALPVGGALRLVNDHDPKPLYYEFSAERTGEFAWTPLERGPEKWVVEIRRVAAAARAIEAPAVRAERPESAGEEPAAVVDVREDLRAGREPFQRIMAGALEVPPGEVLVVRATFDPRPLYAVLKSRGFAEAWAERLGEDDWKVHFLKKRKDGCGCGGGCHG